MEDRKKKIFIWVLLGVLAFLITAIIITTCLLLGKDNDQDPNDDLLVPDYPPQATDPNQSPMENEPDGTLET